MTSELVNLVADLMQISVALLSLIAYIPQWIKLLRKKTSADISLRAWLLWTVSSLFAVFYAVVQLLNHGSGWPLVFSSVVSLAFVMFTVVLVVRYRKPVQNKVLA